MSTPAQIKREVNRTAARLDRAAKIAGQAYDDLHAVFPEYAADGGLRMQAARAAADAASAARNFRQFAEQFLR